MARMTMSGITDLIGTRVILNTGAGCKHRYRTGVIEAETASDLGESGRYRAFTVLLDRLPRERVEKRETVALINGDELVRDKPETRTKIGDWLCEHEPDHRALGWL